LKINYITAYKSLRQQNYSKYTAILKAPERARILRKLLALIERLRLRHEQEEAAEVFHHECYECDGMGFWHILEGYDVVEGNLYFDEPIHPEYPELIPASEYFICASCDGTGEYLAD